MHATYISPAALAAQCLRDDPSFVLMTPAEQRAEARSVLSQINGVDAEDLDLQLETILLASEPVAAAKPSSRIVDTGRKKIVVTQPVAAAPVAPEPVSEVEVAVEPEAPVAASPAASAWMAQPCRNPAGCTETLAATGRCLQCGAQRKQPVASTVTRPALDAAVRSQPDPLFRPGATRSPKANKRPKLVVKTPDRSASTPEGWVRRRALLAQGTLIQKVKSLTNAPDHYLAKLLGRSRPTIHAYMHDRIAPTWSEWQLRQMHQLLLQQRVMLDDAIDHVEATLQITHGVHT